MFKERTVLGHGDRFDQVRRQIGKADGLTAAVALGGDGAEQFGFETCILDLSV